MSDSIYGVTIETVSGVTIFKVRGALKLGESVLDELRGRCCELATRPIERLVLDLEDVPAIDSSGIGVLMHAYTSLHNRGGRCKLLNLAHTPAEVLRVVRLLSVFEVYHDRNAVLASFEPSPQQTKTGFAGGPERAA
ncbi:MAG: STAS domain-containing protein [Terriglobales bacterium]